MCSLFTCESLTKLELSDGPSIHFPKNIFLPKLKILKLSEIQFGDNGCWNEEPVSNFVVLEQLFLHECTWFGTKKFYILTPVLKVLHIVKHYVDEGGLEDCDLKIHAPSLVSLTLWGCVAKDYDMSSFLTLDNAKVVFFIFDDESERGQQKITEAVSKCLRALSHVRYLSLYLDRKQVLSVAEDFVSSLPTYHDLNVLKLLHDATKDRKIFAFLKATPNLKHLIFAEFDNSSDDDEIEDSKTEDLFRYLQSVQFIDFSGRRRESRWAKLILKNAKSLQTMTIRRVYSMRKNNEVVMPELPSLPRASARCVIKVV